MYNLLVTYPINDDDVWQLKGTYSLERSRFLEYTAVEISSKFEGILDQTHIDALKSFPCLFVHENFHGSTRIGRITNIQVQGRTITIDYELESSKIDVAKIPNFESLIGMTGWELSRTHWAIKDIDIHEVLSKCSVPNVTTVAPTIIIPNVASLPQASLPQAKTIQSVSDFINEVLHLKKDGKEFLYRGHADRVNYKLIPSLFRRTTSGEPKHLLVEDKLYRELLISHPGDFRDDNTTLDRLVRMQHFGLPTRLLDITSNPLIALFFACNESPEKNGEIIIFKLDPNRIKYFDSDTASCVANLAMLPQTEKDKINYDLDENSFNEQESVKRLLHFVKEEKPYFEPRIAKSDLKSIICVKSKRSNGRISSQSGAFLLFGQDAEFQEDGMPEIGIDLFRLEISNKEAILSELDQLNINESTVFPDIEHSARYIALKLSQLNPLNPKVSPPQTA
jgi:hypothetical protein